MHFDERYAEEARLEDGTAVRLRLVRSEDKAAMRAAWERLSPESRYRRFLAAKQTLTDRDLAYLTETDGTDHVAIGAEKAGGAGEALGVARFVRLRDRPDTADAAIVVVDAVQGKGLGRLLLSRLAAAARERGVARFSADVLATNAPMLALLKSLAPSAVEHPEGVVVVVDLPTAEAAAGPLPPPERTSPVYRLLKLAASGVLAVRRSLLDRDA